MKKFAVFGNPIQHSLSPQIHRLFAKQFGISLEYQKYFVEQGEFFSEVANFFYNKGDGANVTSPFKEEAYSIVDKLTEQAAQSKSVNVLKLLPNNQLLGDNSDGIGLLLDLQRLDMLHPNDRVLLLGSGGVSRGIIVSLLSHCSELVVSNRTFSKAKNLAKEFSSSGNILAREFSQLNELSFNLIINATSAEVKGEFLEIPQALFSPTIAYYDASYGYNMSSFLKRAKECKSRKLANGLGMLVTQAAYSFKLWHGVMPKIEEVLSYLRSHASFSIGEYNGY